MSSWQPTRAGVCLVRVQTLNRGVFITLWMNLDAEQVSTEHVERVTDLEAAVQIVRAFLVEFVTASASE